ncbi:unnamed protein product, partial (mitochondrion) [Musa banksii]
EERGRRNLVALLETTTCKEGEDRITGIGSSGGTSGRAERGRGLGSLCQGVLPVASGGINFGIGTYGHPWAWGNPLGAVAYRVALEASVCTSS